MPTVLVLLSYSLCLIVFYSGCLGFLCVNGVRIDIVHIRLLSCAEQEHSQLRKVMGSTSEEAEFEAWEVKA